MNRIVSLHLSPPAHEKLRVDSKRSAQASRNDVATVLNRYGAVAKPLFEGPPQGGRENVWQFECSSSLADQIVAELLTLDGVEGAYVEPEATPPGSP